MKDRSTNTSDWASIDNTEGSEVVEISPEELDEVAGGPSARRLTSFNGRYRKRKTTAFPF